MNPIYTVAVVEGLEKIACREMQERLGDAGRFKIIGQKPGRIFFRYDGEPGRLLQLRSAEHVLLIIRSLQGVTRSRSSLAIVKKALSRVDFRMHFDICRKVGLKLRYRVAFRVTSHMSGRRNYRRIDLQQVVEQALLTYGWRLTDENPALDVWVEVHDEEAYISIRLSPFAMAQRDYKQAHIPASLTPTVAYCLVQLSDPRPDDLFLDPMCGAGTILIERACSGRYRYLLGGDISAAAIWAARENIGRKHRPRQLFRWDARSLPLGQWSVDQIVCNPPFGEQTGNLQGIQSLYQQFLQECRRVLKPTGRMALATTRSSLLNSLLDAQKLFKVAQRFPIDLRGQEVSVFLCLPR